MSTVPFLVPLAIFRSSFFERIVLMKSAITLSLVDEARGGPFVLWGDAKNAISQAHQMGFDAIEIFPPDADTLRHLFLPKTLADHGLSVAALILFSPVLRTE